MDVYRILGELRKEREHIEESFLALERLARVVTAQAGGPQVVSFAFSNDPPGSRQPVQTDHTASGGRVARHYGIRSFSGLTFRSVVNSFQAELPVVPIFRVGHF